jgi:PAS domain S-box-containing protein
MGEAARTRTPDIELFRDVFNASPIGIVVETLEGQPLFVNPAFCSMLGFSEEELRTKHCVDFSPPEDAEKDWSLFQKLRAGSIDHYQMEKRYFRRDGSLVWGSLSISLLKSRPAPLVLAMVEDITEKKKAEEARFRHAAIVESSEDAIASVTLDGVIVRWNAGAEHIYGYSEAEAVGKSVNILVPPELRDEENKILETLRAGGRIEHFETIRVTKTGKRINVSLSISPIKDSSGEIIGLSGIARDISDRKRHEEKLREYERAIENAEEMIAVVDREYRYLIANRQFLKMRNMTHGQVVGRFAHEVLKEGVFEAEVKPRLDECFMGKVVRYEMKYTYPELGERDVLVSYFPIEGTTGIDRVVCILQDTTDRKRAEEELLEMNRALEAHSSLLRSREELLKTFVKNVPAAVAMLDREMRYLQVSDRWCTDYLSGRKQIVGRSHYEIFPDMPERWKEVHRRGLQGETLRADEDRWDGQDGPHWARWEVLPWKTPEGTVGGILILAEDITRRKQMEEMLSGMTRKLIEAQEQERARIGRELHDDISQRLALAAIELQQLHDDPLILPEVRSRMGKLLKQTSEIGSDVQSLSHELHSSKLEYLGMAPAMRSLCYELSRQHKVEIVFACDDIPSTVPKDIALSLFRVLQEGLQNAVKHSGVRRFDVELRYASDAINLSVRDSGSGFDRDDALKARGLGLISMTERMKLVGGRISIDSEPQRGTTIRASVPLEKGLAANAG